MSLRPITVSPSPIESNLYLIQGNGIFSFPFTVTEAGVAVISAQQVGTTEDFTLSAWVSSEAGGNCFDCRPFLYREHGLPWRLIRDPSGAVHCYNYRTSQNFPYGALPLPVGQYFFNVQNDCMDWNHFIMTLTNG